MIDQNKPDARLFSQYSDFWNKYRNLLTSKIFDKSEQIKNEFRMFIRVNGLILSTVPDSLEAYSSDKIKIKLTFMTPQPDRAQVLLTVYFTSPKEFYLNIFHTQESVKQIYTAEEVTPSDLKQIKNFYDDLLMSDVFISVFDKDRLTPGEETKYTSFIDVMEELYQEPRKY